MSTKRSRPASKNSKFDVGRSKFDVREARLFSPAARQARSRRWQNAFRRCWPLTTGHRSLVAAFFKRLLAQPKRGRRRNPVLAWHHTAALEPLEPRQLLATVTWTGAGTTSDWSEAANWAGDDDAIVDSNDTVVFDATSGANSTIDANFAIQRLQVGAGYTGTISLGANTLSTSSEFTVAGATSFAAGIGTVRFTHHSTVNSAATLYNLEVDIPDPYDLTLSQDLLVNNDLLITEVDTIVGANLQVAGNVISNTSTIGGTSFISLVGGTDQTLSGSGVLRRLDISKAGGDVSLPANVTITDQLTGDGLIRNDGGRLIFSTPGIVTADFSGSIDDLELNLADPYDLVLSQDLLVNNDLLITEVDTIVGANLQVAGNVVSNTSTIGGTSFIRLVGGTDQTLSGSGVLRRLDISKTGGDVSLPANVTITDQLTGDGLIRNDGGRLVFSTPGIVTADFSGSIDDLELNLADPYDLVLSQDLLVNNDLLITEVDTIVGANLQVAGNVVSNTSTIGGTSFISLVGGTDQTLSGSGVLRRLDISKTGGDVSLPANVTITDQLTGDGLIRNDGGRLVFSTPGIVTADFSGSIDDLELNLADPYDLVLSQDLLVNNDLLITEVDTIVGANLQVAGNVVSNTSTIGGTSFISLVGSTDQTLSGSGLLNRLDASKTGGDVLMSTFNTNFAKVTVSAGQWDVLGNTVAATSGFIAQGGKITGAGTLDGNVTVNSGGTLGGTVTVNGTVTANSGGSVAPGNSPGIISSGSLTLNSGSSFDIEVNGTGTAGVDYDQYIVTGSVSLGGATLNTTGTVTAPGTIVIIDNDGTDNVSGTFAGLANNDVVTINSVDFRIQYNIGNNDVVLIPANAAPVVDLNDGGAGIDETTAFTEFFGPGGNPIGITDSLATVTDADGDELAGMTITAGGVQDGDSEILNVLAEEFELGTGTRTATNVPVDTISVDIGFNATSGVFTIIRSGGGTIPLSEATLIARSLIYDHDSDTPTAGNRTFQVVANDGTVDSAAATATVIVTPTDDPPTITVTPVITDLDEDAATTPRIKVADIATADPDGAAGTVSLYVTDGGIDNDASLFEIDGSELFLVDGAALDYETNPSLDILVNINDDGVGADPDDNDSFSLTINNVGTTDVSVVGSDLVITDTRGGDTDDTLTISNSGANVRITDPNNELLAGAGATQVDANTIDVPLGAFTGNVIVNTLAGDDSVTFDSSFDIGSSRGVTVDGGADSDTVNWDATAQLASLAVTAESINLLSGTVDTGTGDQSYNGAVQITVGTTVTGGNVTYNGTLDGNGAAGNVAAGKPYSFSRLPGESGTYYKDDTHVQTANIFDTGELTDGIVQSGNPASPAVSPTLGWFHGAGPMEFIFDLNSISSINEIVVGTRVDGSLSNATPDDVQITFSTTGTAPGDFGNLVTYSFNPSPPQGRQDVPIAIASVPARYVKLLFDGGAAPSFAAKNMLDEIQINVAPTPLTINASGDVAFNGVVGGAGLLTSLKVDSTGGSVDINAAINVGSGGLDIDPPDTITVNAPINSAGGPVNLEANNGITIDAELTTGGGAFTANADADNDGTGTFEIATASGPYAFVDWTAVDTGVLPDSTAVTATVSGAAVESTTTNGSFTGFSNAAVYDPAQASGDGLRIRYFAMNDYFTINFSQPVASPRLHMGNVQSFGTGSLVYEFSATPVKVSGVADWDISGNVLRQLSGGGTTELNGTVEFPGVHSSITITRLTTFPSGNTDGTIWQLAIPTSAGGSIATDSGAASITAADGEIGGPISGTSTLEILPSQAGQTIGLGGGSGAMNLDDSELGNLQDGFSSITIGDANAGDIDIDTATFSDPLNLITGGEVHDHGGTDINMSSGDTVTIDGTVTPGQSPGVLVVNGNFTFASGDTFEVEIDGTAGAGATGGHDQLQVLGDSRSITLNDAELNVVLNAAPAVGSQQVYTIVDAANDNSTRSGLFSFGGTTLNDGDEFTVGSTEFTINYLVGGDVILTESGNSAPEIAAQNFNADENQTAVGTVTATDDDLPGDTQTFSITSAVGLDNGLFSITPAGVLSFNAAPDFENPQDVGGTPGDNIYQVEVQIEDSAGATDTAIMSVTVNDLQYDVSITANDPDAAESGDDGQFTISLPSGVVAPIGGLDVNYNVTGTASATDYAALSGTVTIPAGQNSATIDIDVTDENLVEINETVIITLDSTSDADFDIAGSPNDNGVVTIADDDSATISIGDVSVVEQHGGGAAQLIFDVTLDADVDVGIDVDYLTQDGTAENQAGDDDYTSTNGTLNFAGTAGETHQVIVNVTGDSTVELDETMQVILENLQASQRDVSLVGTATVIGGNPGVFVNSGQSLGNERSNRVALGDLDGDGDLDAYVSASTQFGSSNRVYLNDGNGVFAQTGQSFGLTNSHGASLGDIDGDNDLDVIVANFGGRDEVWLNDGSANFTLHQSLFASGSTNQWSFKGALADVDADGDLDIYMAMHLQGNRVWLNNGTGTFTDSGQLLGSGGSRDVVMVDVDGDSDLDAFVANGAANKVWLNDGSGTFTDSGQNLGNVLSERAAVGDIDGDGDTDVVTPTRFPAPYTNEVWLNDGSGNFTAGNFFGSTESGSLALGDVDGDGDLDAVDTSRPTGEPHKVWLNDGSGVFTDSGNDFVIHSVNDVALGDLDSDGDLDAFLARFSFASADQVWINQGVATGAVSATGTILNDDSAVVSITGESKDEGTGGSTTYTFDVDLSQPVDVAVSMTADTQDGTATAADDFTAIAGATVSFAAESTATQTVNVTVGADNKVELDEAFDLVLSALSAGGRDVTFVGAGATESATAEVNNDDSATISIADATILEGDSGNQQLVFDVTLSNPVDTAVMVDYQTQDGTAEDENGDADYESTSGTLTINANSLFGQIIVNVTEDDKVELDETLQVILDSLDADGRDVTFTEAYSSTVLNDGPIGYWRLGEAAGATSLLDSSGNGRHLTVSGIESGDFGQAGALPSDPDTAIRFNDAADHASRGNTTDFAFASGQSFSVEFWVKIPVSPAMIKQAGVLTKGYDSTQVQPLYLFMVNPAGEIIFTLRSGVEQLAKSLPRNDNNWHQVVGVYDATNNEMRLYVDSALEATQTGVVQAAYGTGSRPFTLGNHLNRITDWSLDEVAIYDRALTDTEIANHSNSVTATGTIENDDAAPVANDDTNQVDEEFGIVDVVTNNGTGNVLLDVDHLDGFADVADTDADMPTGGLVVDDVDGNAISGATNIAGTWGTLTINPDGSYTYDLDDANPALETLDDGSDVTDSFTYTASDGTNVSNSATLTITIHGTTDNSPPEIEPQSFDLDENTDNLTSVGFVAADDPDLPADTLTWTITSGNTGGAFSLVSSTGELKVANKAALDFETTPVFYLTVEVEDDFGETDDAIITVNLNDLEATLSIADKSGLENAGPLVFDVVLTGNDINNAFDVTYSTTDGTAQDAGAGVGSNDYDGTASSTIGFDGNATSETEQITITINGDSVVEDNETFHVNLLSTTSNDISFTDDTAEGTINNDDSATLTIADAIVVEGDPGDNQQLVFNLTLDNPIDVNIQVDYETNNGTAGDGTGGSDNDYVADSDTLTINANTLTGQIIVNITEDDKVELDETMEVLLSSLDAGGRDVVLSTDYASAVGSDGPIGYWRLGEAAGATQAVDSSGNNRHLNLSGFETDDFGQAGALAGDPNHALRFDDFSSHDRADHTNSTDFGFASGQSFSVEFWIKVPSLPDTFDPGIITKGYADGQFRPFYLIKLSQTSGGIVMDLRNSPGVTRSVESPPVIDNEWHHVVGVYDAGSAELRLYVDSELAGTATSVPAAAYGTNSEPLSLGAHSTFQGRRPNWTLDEVAIYEQALGDAAIEHHFNSVTATGTIQNDDYTPAANDDTNQVDEEFGAVDVVTNNITGNVLLDVAHGVGFADVADTDADMPTGGLVVADVDSNAISGATNIAGTWGTLTMNPDGSYTYDLDDANPALDTLDDGSDVTDSFTYTATDGSNSSNPATLTITIHGTTDNLPPEIDPQSFSLDENTDNLTSVGFVDADDPDLPGDTLTWTITLGNTGGAFSIVSSTGELKVANKAALDFETTPVFNLTVEVEDDFGETDDAIITVNLNDLEATLSIDDKSGLENAGPLVFDVVLTGDDINNAFDVTYSTTDGTAQDAGAGVGSNDYDGTASSTIGFDGNATSETEQITITINGDSVVEDNETFHVNLLSTTSNDISFTDDTAEGTINNDDSATLTIADAIVVEGDPGDNQQLVFNLTLDNPIDVNIQVDYETNNGTAGDGTGGSDNDYVADSDTLTINANTLTGQIIVNITEDDKVELDETMEVLLSSLDAGGRDVVLSTDYASAVGSDGPIGYWRLGEAAGATQAVDSSGNNRHLNLSGFETDDFGQAGALAGDPNHALRFDDFSSHDRADHTNSTDFGFASGQSFSVEFWIKVPSLPDTFDPGIITKGYADGQFRPFYLIKLSQTSGGIVMDLRNSPGVTRSVESPPVIDNEWHHVVGVYDAGSAELRLYVDSELAGTATSVPAAAYGTNSEPLSLGAHSTFQGRRPNWTLDEVAIYEQALGDAAIEHHFNSVTATGTIINDDSATVSVGDATITEGGNLEFDVTLTQPVDVDTMITYSTADGSATTADNDYTGQTAQTLTVPAGQTSGAITVATTADNKVELNETMNVNLTAVAASGRDVTILDGTGEGTIENDDKATLSIDNVSKPEDGTFTFTITSDKLASKDITVVVNTADIVGQATAGSDYTAIVNQTVTIAAGTTFKTVTATVNDDAIVEDDETFAVNLSDAKFDGVSDPTRVMIGDSQGIGTIENNDSATLSITAPTITETNADQTTLVFTVEVDAAVEGGFKVAFSDLLSGTATVVDDYTVDTASPLTFDGTAGEQETIALTIKGETIVEDNETFTLKLGDVTMTSSEQDDNITTGAQATATIDNDDSATLSITAPTITETNADQTTLVFTVEVDAAVEGGFKVAFSDLLSGTATVVDDYTVDTASPLTFDGTAGEQETIALTIKGETIVEDNETFTLKLGDVTMTSSEQDDNITTGAQATATIDNDDSATLSITAPTITETDADQTTLVFTVEVDAAVEGGFKVAFSDLLSGTATVVDDYTVDTASPLTFDGTAGEQETIALTIKGETIVEDNETFTLKLGDVTMTSSEQDDNITTGAQATATIDNDDSATLSITAPTITETNADQTTLVFTVEVDAAVEGGFKVAFSDLLSGTATVVDDYTVDTASPLTFDGTAGEQETITLTIKGETIVEDNETFTLKLGDVTMTSSEQDDNITTGAQATATIGNDDSATLSITAPTITETNADQTTLVFTVEVDAAVEGGFKVAFSDLLSGTATVVDDYTVDTASPLTFDGTAGEQETIALTIKGETIVEDNETFTLKLGDVTMTSSEQDDNITTGAQATATIENDDSATLTIAAPSITEADSDFNVNFTVTLDAEVEGGFDVAHALSLGTAEGSDVTVVTASPISFAGTAGETQDITVTIEGDDIVEDNETFTITLGDVTDTTAEQDGGIATGDSAEGTINNDDQATLIIDDVSVVEGDVGMVNAVFTVTLDSEVEGDVMVDFATADNSAQDENGDNDYSFNNGMLSIAAGSVPGATQSVTVQVNGDYLVEPNETYFVNLSNLQAGGLDVIFGDSQGLGTIENDDFLGGRVFDDLDNDGVFEPGDGDAGIGGVLMQLIDQGSGTAVDTDTTDASGRYEFDVTLPAGTYKIVEAAVAGLLDGKETAGVNDGTVDNSQDSNEITDIDVSGTGTADEQAVDYLFAEVGGSDIHGTVWEDFNNDGEINFGEASIDGVSLTLTGTDDRGNPVSQSAVTSGNGAYAFIDLRPGTYSIEETQPAGYDDGQEPLGEVTDLGLPTAVADAGYIDGNDRFSGIQLVPKSEGDLYNFGERPQAGGEIGDSTTATIGFWHNKNGQALIKSLNGSESSTQLGDWLATTFPDMYGPGAYYEAAKGPGQVMNLTGMTNAEVAEIFKYLHKRNKKSAVAGGPPKVDAQVMAVALATYVTSENLAGGDYAASYGFNTSADGIAYTTFHVLDVLSAQEADDLGLTPVMDGSGNATIIDILLTTNDKADEGLLYDEDGSGSISSFEVMLRTLANELYTAINEGSDI